MILGLVGLWAVVILLIRLAFSDRSPMSDDRPTPLAELDGRLARGEISPEDYATTRRLLTGGH